ncbi:helix-turn-helix domain-containing protein [Thermogemmatispora carboxidivorans]|uniref:helix-turn-helix domain-containing protein n=1 Tax=Thermogemmatispora carboxidivorans TaxID=1382306 RepID=UPI0012DC6F24
MSINKLSQCSGASYHIISALCSDPCRAVITDILQRLASALGISATKLIEDVSDEQWSRETGKGD